MFRVVMTEDEALALPTGSLVLTTDAVWYTHTQGIKFDWGQRRLVPLTSAQLADGRPILVLWDPSAPEVLLSAWSEAMAYVAPHRMASGGVELFKETMAQPGAEVMTELVLREADMELEGLAVLDFVSCWSKKVTP